MRRLLIVTVILTGCASLLLLGIRMLRPEPASTACLQLLSPTTGDVLTVDAATGASLLDPRADFPTSLSDMSSRPPYLPAVSPDYSHVIDAIDVTKAGPSIAVLMVRRRSTTHRRLLDTTFTAYDYLWSPDSRHIALADLKGWGGGTILAQAVITDVANPSFRNESRPFTLDGNWFNYALWSPDSTLLALPTQRTQSPTNPYLPDATLILLPAAAEQPIQLFLPNEAIERMSWSPDSQVMFVFTHDASATYHRLHVIRRDGQVVKQVDLTLGFTPRFSLARPYVIDAEWSPDGQYFYLLQDDGVARTLTDIYSLNGDRILQLPIKATNISPMWSAQSHTLLYSVDDAYSLTALDVATGYITTLADHVEDHTVEVAPNDAMIAVITSPAPNHLVPRIISRDLSQNVAPFGELTYREYASPVWSPDSQKVALVTEDDTEFTVTWEQVDRPDAEAKSVRFPKNADDPQEEMPYIRWITNDTLLVKHYGADYRTWRLDTTSSSLVMLYLSPVSDDFYTVWNDAIYVADGPDTNLVLYRLSDGVALFSGLPPLVDDPWLPFIEPHERAMLLLRGPDSQYGTPNLHLITPTSTQLLTVAAHLTYPAWSPDGELFTFATIEKFKAGWTLKIMSRDGSLLRSFLLPTSTSTTPYQQVRWTNCE